MTERQALETILVLVNRAREDPRHKELGEEQHTFNAAAAVVATELVMDIEELVKETLYEQPQKEKAL